MTKLFALDQNFPEPIVDALNEYIIEAELVPVRVIDPLLAEVDDWQLFVALRHHERRWDGLITTNSAMLKTPREVAAVEQTGLSLVVASAAGHDPLKATGILFVWLGWICKESKTDEPQIWDLVVKNRPCAAPSVFIERIANHTNRPVEEVWAEGRLSNEELAVDPLAMWAPPG